MLCHHGDKCPAYESYTVGVGEEPSGPIIYHCEHCVGCKGIFSNGIDCGFSKTPIGLPKFHVGQLVYRHGFIRGERLRVMSCEWDGKFEYHYILRSVYSTRSERHHSGEHTLYATAEESDRAAIEKDLTALMESVAQYEKKYNKPLPSIDIKKLLGPKSSTECQGPRSSQPSD